MTFKFQLLVTCRAEQSRAEQSRAEQSRAEQSRAEQSRAEQSRAEQSRAEQSRAEQKATLWCNYAISASLSGMGDFSSGERGGDQLGCMY